MAHWLKSMHCEDECDTPFSLDQTVSLVKWGSPSEGPLEKDAQVQVRRQLLDDQLLHEGRRKRD